MDEQWDADTRARPWVWWLVPVAAVAVVGLLFVFGRPAGEDKAADGTPAAAADSSTTTTTTTAVATPPMDDPATCEARDRFIAVSVGITPESDQATLVQSLDDMVTVLGTLEGDTSHEELLAHVAVLRPAVEEGLRLVRGAQSPDDLAALGQHPLLSAPDVAAAAAGIASFPLRCAPAA